ncbi:GPI-anchored protein LLG1-like protein [Tanacetum coccineum]
MTEVTDSEGQEMPKGSDHPKCRRNFRSDEGYSSRGSSYRSFGYVSLLCSFVHGTFVWKARKSGLELIRVKLPMVELLLQRDGALRRPSETPETGEQNLACTIINLGHGPMISEIQIQKFTVPSSGKPYKCIDGNRNTGGNAGRSSKLEKIKINNLSIEEDIWLEHLSELHITSRLIFGSELNFVKLILAKSPVLKKVTIRLDYRKFEEDEELQILQVLLSSPRASPMVEIIAMITYNGSESSSFGRNLLQAKKPCPVNFEFMNYTIITSQCKGPSYPHELCSTNNDQLYMLSYLKKSGRVNKSVITTLYNDFMSRNIAEVAAVKLENGNARTPYGGSLLDGLVVRVALVGV